MRRAEETPQSQVMITEMKCERSMGGKFGKFGGSSMDFIHYGPPTTFCGIVRVLYTYVVGGNGANRAKA